LSSALLVVVGSKLDNLYFNFGMTKKSNYSTEMWIVSS